MGEGSYRQPADRKKKSLFDKDLSDSLKDLFADEEVDYSWKPFETETPILGDRCDSHTPRGSEESACDCNGTPCETTCGSGCACGTPEPAPALVPVKKVAPDFYKKMKKESTERLMQKLESGKYSEAEKKIIVLVLELRHSK